MAGAIGDGELGEYFFVRSFFFCVGVVFRFFFYQVIFICGIASGSSVLGRNGAEASVRHVIRIVTQGGSHNVVFLVVLFRRVFGSKL